MIVVSAPMLSEPEIDRVVCELRQLYNCTGLELAIATGKLLLERIFGGDAVAWESRGKKDTSFRRLELHPDLPFRASTLWKSVAVYLVSRRCPDLLQMHHLGPSHVQEVVGLADSLQDALLKRAQDEHWTVQQIRAERRRLESRDVKQHGRPRLPVFVKCLRQAREIVEDRLLLTDLDEAADLDLSEAKQLLDIARRLCQHAEAIARQLASHIADAEVRSKRNGSTLPPRDDASGHMPRCISTSK
jgi:hypothetical protein